MTRQDCDMASHACPESAIKQKPGIFQGNASVLSRKEMRLPRFECNVSTGSQCGEVPDPAEVLAVPFPDLGGADFLGEADAGDPFTVSGVVDRT